MTFAIIVHRRRDEAGVRSRLLNTSYVLLLEVLKCRDSDEGKSVPVFRERRGAMHWWAEPEFVCEERQTPEWEGHAVASRWHTKLDIVMISSVTYFMMTQIMTFAIVHTAAASLTRSCPLCPSPCLLRPANTRACRVYSTVFHTPALSCHVTRSFTTTHFLPFI